MTIDTIAAQCFIAVADTKSFTKASHRVGRSQSAVSQQISKLENLVDKQLFIRGKTLKLTSDGEVFLNYARQISKLHKETIEHFKEPELYGEVRFGVPEDFASVFLYNVLSDFSQANSRISLHIECDLTRNLYKQFQNKELDLAIIKTSKKNEFTNATKLFSEKLIWVGDSKLIKKNEEIPLVISPKPCVYHEAMVEALDKKKIKWRIAFSSYSYAGKIAALKAGIGITTLPYKMIPKELIHIKSRLLPNLKESHIFLLKNSKNNAVINSFENFVIKYLQ